MLRNNRKLVLACLCLALIMVLGLASESLASHAAVFLIDRSGSMNQTRWTGNSRFYDARESAKDDVDALFDLDAASVVRIGYYSCSGIEFSAPMTDASSAKAAIDAITFPYGKSPLADAMCAATQELASMSGAPKYLYTYTDGDENFSQGGASDTCTACIDYFPYPDWPEDCVPPGNEPYWCSEAQLCISDCLLSYPEAYYFEYFGFEYDKKGGMQPGLAGDAPRGYNPSHLLLEYLAQESGGTIVLMPDNENPESVPALGWFGGGILVLFMALSTVWIVHRRSQRSAA